ncbi:MULTISPECIES: MFS transporter [Natrialbaceae]|uniref:MFS transporter n=1 Tax=Natrialbaceae TaxID=1644061 RepID=UPI00207C868D|nr:MFS transporter [Natronococcus sp. CG52]
MSEGASRYRWRFVVAAALAAGLAGTYQFVWPVLRDPIVTESGASSVTIGTVFTVLVVTQTLAAFPSGWVRDRVGPRIPMLVATLFVVVGYAGVALVPGVPELYLWFAIGGAGVGIAYNVAINTPAEWFRTRRGLTTGVVSMSFSLTSFVLVPVLRWSVHADYAATMLALAAAAGATSLLAALVLRDPTPGGGAVDATATDGGTRPVGDDASAEPERVVPWRAMIRTREFWLLYAIFVAVNGVGLMVLEKAVTYGSQLGFTGAQATAAAAVIALGQGMGVLFGGAASDKLGPKRTIAGSLFLSGIAVCGIVSADQLGLGWVFVACVGLVMFFRSPAFGILPGVVNQRYGQAYASENYGVMLTAKLWGGVFGGTLTSLLVARVGWSATFLVGAALALGVGALALVAFHRETA